jgi:CheY-like chemotaxis protein
MVMDDEKLQELAILGKELNLLILEDNKMVQRVLDVLLEPYFKAVNILSNAKEAISHYNSTKYDIVLINIETTEVKDTVAWEAINDKDTFVIVYAINKENQELEKLSKLGIVTCEVDSIKDDIGSLYQKLLDESKNLINAKNEKEVAKNTVEEDKVYDFESNCDMEEINSILDDIDAIYGEIVLSTIQHENMINIYNTLIRLYNSLSTFTNSELKDKLESFTELIFDLADFMLFINLDILNNQNENNAYKVFEHMLESVIKSIENGFKKGNLAEIKRQETAIKNNLNVIKKELGIL